MKTGARKERIMWETEQSKKEKERREKKNGNIRKRNFYGLYSNI